MTSGTYKVIIVVLLIGLVITSVGWAKSYSRLGSTLVDLSEDLDQSHDDLVVCEGNVQSEDCQEVLRDLSAKISDYKTKLSSTSTASTSVKMGM